MNHLHFTTVIRIHLISLTYHIFVLCHLNLVLWSKCSFMAATMANLLFFISVIILLTSFVVLLSNSFVFPACVSSSNRSTSVSFNADIYDCGNYKFGNFSGISSIITRCCCNVLPTSSRSPSGLIGPGPSLFSSSSVLLWSQWLALYRSIRALPIDLLPS